MKLHFTRKTWYFMLLLAAACSLADAIGLLVGENMAFLETLSFALSGMAVLFLAAVKQLGPNGEKGRTANPDSGKYMAAFFVLLLSYLLFGWQLAARLTFFWPVLAWVELRRGQPVKQHLQLLIFSEIVQIGIFLAQLSTGLGLAAGILWVLVCVTRGWLALTLYRQSEE